MPNRVKSSIMGRKVPEWADSQFSFFLGQPIMELVPKWARVPTWSEHIHIYITRYSETPQRRT